jgi:hypothetical protein
MATTRTWNEEFTSEKRQEKVFTSGRILTVIPIMFLLFDGAMKLINVTPVIEAQRQLGIPGNLTVVIGILELACVAFYAIPSTAVLGAVLLTGYLGGAISIQLRVGNPLFTHVLFPTYVAALLWGGLYLRDSRLRQFLPRREKRNAMPSPSKRMNFTLWVLQVLLALTFLFAGGMKLIVPYDQLMAMGSPNQIVLPSWFIHLIGVAEVLGAIGLILPRLLGIRPTLTAWAAAGLVLIMIGATGTTLASGDVAGAVVPLVVGILAIVVAYGRR